MKIVYYAIILSTLYCTANAQLADSPWPKSAKDSRNSACAPTTNTSTAVTKWAVRTGINNLSQAVIGTNGDIFVSGMGNIVCVSSAGTLKWTSTGNGPITSSMAIGSDGTIYCANSTNSKFYAVDGSSGSLKWSVSLDQIGSASPAIGPTGTIYFQTRSYVYGLDPADGHTKWSVPATGVYPYSPVVATDEDGYPLVITPTGPLYTNLTCIRDNGNSATVVWNATTTYNPFQLTLSNDGSTVYSVCGSTSALGNVLAFDTMTGAMKWSLTTGGVHTTGPAIGSDGTLYISSNYKTTPKGTGNMFAVRDNGTSGEVKWVCSSSYNEGLSSPMTTAGGAIYATSNMGRVVAFQDKGSSASVLWTYKPATTVKTPCIGADGTLYVSSPYGASEYIFTALATDKDHITQVSKISDAKLFHPADLITLSTKCVSAGPGGGIPNNVFYLEETDRSCALRVVFDSAIMPQKGDTINVTGQMSTVSGEQVLVASSFFKVGTDTVKPVWMNNRALGSAISKGILTKVTGRVTSQGTDYFVLDGKASNPASGVKVIVGNCPKSPIGAFATWTGISTYTDRPALLCLKPGPYDTPPGYMSMISQDILVVIYTNTNGGTISETDVPLIMQAANDAKLSYQRNTHSLYNQNLYQLVIRDDRDIIRENCYIYPATVQEDLHAQGIVDDQYDGVIVVAKGSGNWGWGANQILGTGGYCQTGWWGYKGHDFYFIHEYGHVLDSMFDATGFPLYPCNHPGVNKELIGVTGGNYDLNADINRKWDHWLELATNPKSHWGHFEVVVDADQDGMPDNDSRLAMDELRLGSSPTAADTDGDGLNDLGEFMAGCMTSSNPNIKDTDGDGVQDGADPYAIYPLSPVITNKTLTLNSALYQRTLLGAYFYSNVSKPVSLYANYDANYLHLAIRTSFNGPNFILCTDNNNDGLFHGTDNYRFVLNSTNNTLTEKSLYDASVSPDDFLISTLTDTIQTRCVTTSGQTTIYMAIPKNVANGLNLTSGEEIGLQLSFDGYGGMFEPDVYLRVKLQ